MIFSSPELTPNKRGVLHGDMGERSVPAVYITSGPLRGDHRGVALKSIPISTICITLVFREDGSLLLPPVLLNE
jgi:hypothetical protein